MKAFSLQLRVSIQIFSQGDRIRTCDIQLPKLALYQAELRPVNKGRAKNREIRVKK